MPTYDDSTIRQRLMSELPSWEFDGRHLVRRYQTGGWRATLMIVNAIGHISELAFHHPDLAVSFASVTVNLMSHDANGITDKDFALALEIERLITWRPPADSALEGLPQESKFTYLKAD